MVFDCRLSSQLKIEMLLRTVPKFPLKLNTSAGIFVSSPQTGRFFFSTTSFNISDHRRQKFIGFLALLCCFKALNETWRVMMQHVIPRDCTVCNKRVVLCFCSWGCFSCINQTWQHQRRASKILCALDALTKHWNQLHMHILHYLITLPHFLIL